MKKEKPFKELTRNPKVHVDYTDLNAVKEYYNSFEAWSFYVNMGDCKGENMFLIEVTDDFVLHNGEYYMPSPVSTYENTYGKREAILLPVPATYRGWCWAYMIKKKEHEFDRSKSGKPISEQISATYTYNLWHVYAEVNKNPTVEQLQNLKPNSKEIYAYPYGGDGRDFKVEYSQSARSGVRIEGFSIQNFRQWFIKNYLCQNGSYGKQTVFPSDKFLGYVEYGDVGFGESISEQINKLLNNSRYRLDDSESWMDASCGEAICRLVEARLKSWNG